MLDDLLCRHRQRAIATPCLLPGGIEADAHGARTPMPPDICEPGWTDPAFFADMARMAAGRVVGIGRIRASDRSRRRGRLFSARRRRQSSPAQHLGASGGMAML
jgi:hypothetical protein